MQTEKDLKSVFPKNIGTAPLTDNLVWKRVLSPEIVMEYLVKFVKAVIPIEKNPLKQ